MPIISSFLEHIKEYIRPMISSMIFCDDSFLLTFTEQSWLHVANSDSQFGFQSNPWIFDKWAAIYCNGDVPFYSKQMYIYVLVKKHCKILYYNFIYFFKSH